MGYALLAGLAAVVVLVSSAVFVGFGVRGGAPDTAAPRGGENAAPASSGAWVGTWSASPAAAEPNAPDGHPDASLRNVVHTSVGGSAARIQISNLFGTRPLTVTHATLALAAAPSAPDAAPGSMRRLTFGGRTEVTVPVGDAVTSDAVRLNVPAAADLLVTLYSPTGSGAVTHHPSARQTSYLARGDRAADTEGTAYTEQTTYWRHLTAVDVWTHEAEGAVVAFGDSITDGITSSVGANHRWTDFLADRLRTERGAPAYSVLNQGISGNRILLDAPANSPGSGPSGLSRLERDALSRTGARVLVIQLGINDILKSPHQTDPGRIVDGLEELTQRAHRRGLRVIGATLMPFGGHRKHTARLEAVRQQVNEQIRRGGVFDAVVDFDAALRDPAHPERLLPVYDSGDHLHPSDSGFRAMAEALDPNLLRGASPARL
ncbi:SGNH/GDSL hydrolase family protein [Streptomyces sp. DH37]|uniref:SGNH/GDSL hydrolase family protein n=1 Tax=Streptomyces sp. DH37 TaxID=3040122 RepID=UPI0024434F4E|nr:SGNH/GDSL hydrolase family protein [Streptomyces sp. DH37]MDG9704237.1 SGNH/GDSL hydrolase family protein [Streptomyces sp. DH37]